LNFKRRSSYRKSYRIFVAADPFEKHTLETGSAYQDVCKEMFEWDIIEKPEAQHAECKQQQRGNEVPKSEICITQ